MPSKKLASTSSASKTRSSKSAASRALKPGTSLLPLAGKKTVAAKPTKKAKVHKAKDLDLRDALNEQDQHLRHALEAKQQPKGPIVEKKPAPKELGPAGSDLAKAMDELEMAFAA